MVQLSKILCIVSKIYLNLDLEWLTVLLRSGQTNDYKIGICCFSTKHATLRRKSKDYLARIQNNVSEWSDMSTRGLLFQ
jgi:hypothetical protein